MEERVKQVHGRRLLVLLMWLPGMVIAERPAPASSLHLEIAKDGEFQVLLSRNQGPGASTIFLGLLGYGVLAGSQASRDNARERAVAESITAVVCRDGFERELVNRLEGEGIVVESEPNSQTSSLTVRIVGCGFKVTDRTNETVSAYFEAEYVLGPSISEKRKKLKRLLVIGRRSAPWSEYERSGAVAAGEFQEVLSRAGRTLASRFIYSRGR